MHGRPVCVPEEPYSSDMVKRLSLRLLCKLVQRRLGECTRQWQIVTILRRFETPKRIANPAIKPRLPLFSGSCSPISVGKKVPLSPTKSRAVVKKSHTSVKPPEFQRTNSTSPITVTPKRNDVGIRLFNQAMEQQARRASLQKSQEPQYPFSPRLAQFTEKWLEMKLDKELGRKEEVAVVSSAAAVGVFGLRK